MDRYPPSAFNHFNSTLTIVDAPGDVKRPAYRNTSWKNWKYGSDW
jgi:hypothetical protein